MSEQATSQHPLVFTIGHSNHDEQTVVGLLQRHQAEVHDACRVHDGGQILLFPELEEPETGP